MRVRWIVLAGAVAAAAALLLVLGIRGTLSEKPPLQIFPDMKLQPKYRAQGENHFFADRRDMRTPPSGTVAYGGRNYGGDAGHPVPNPDFVQDDSVYYLGSVEVTLGPGGGSAVGAAAGGPGAVILAADKPRAWVDRIPALQQKEGDPRWAVLDQKMMNKGQQVFNMTCALCHGQTGNGKGVTRLYGMQPANLHDDRIADQPDGEIYNTLTNGKQSMKGYAHMIRPNDRWAVVAYVRALQRSQRITADELRRLYPAEAGKLGIKP